MELTEYLVPTKKHTLVEFPDQDISYSGPKYDGVIINISFTNKSVE